MTLGPRLADLEEPLFRQVHPSWIQEGRPTSQAFRPTSKDEGLLSVSRGTRTTAKDAFELHTRVKGLHSVGVWAVNVGHCEHLALGVFEDPVTEPVADPAHAVVDYRALTDKEARAKSQLLRGQAEPVYVEKPEAP